MDQRSGWDWETGKRSIAELNSWKEDYNWIEEPYVSPDGERIAAVVRTDDEMFSVCVNGTIWPNRFDKVWYPRFGPDSRLTALVSDSGEWTVAVDGNPWENRFDFVWNTQFSQNGNQILIAAIDSEKGYLAVGNDLPWENGFSYMSHVTLSPDGQNTCAVVQTIPGKERDVVRFQKGCFSVAVNGALWEREFVNAWDPAFSRDGNHVAACVRTTLYDYTIALNGNPWKNMFSSVWAPQFNPADGSVTAPVRVEGKWFLARDGELLSDRGFVQLWNHRYSPDGQKIAAIVAPKFGRWTVAVEGKPWTNTFGDLATDLVFSPDARRAAFVGKDGGNWHLCVDDRIWDGAYDMAWAPVFSPDGTHVAAKVEKDGLYTILLDGIPLQERFEALWDPVFSPDGAKVLIRGIGSGQDKGRFLRIIIMSDN